MRRFAWGVVVGLMGALLTLPVEVSAQMHSWKDVQVQDIETMKGKFAGLAEAFDESQYDWRPMDGVRSVREVLALAVAEAHLFPGLWGATPPARANRQFGAELQRVAAMDKGAILGELDTSFDFLIEQVNAMSDETRMAQGSYFGTSMPNHAVLAQAMGDMHEHLGQLIAYARTNKVVPPWSM